MPSATGFLATAEAAALEAATKGRTTFGAAKAPEAGVVADDTATEFVSVVAGRDGEVKTETGNISLAAPMAAEAPSTGPAV